MPFWNAVLPETVEPEPTWMPLRPLLFAVLPETVEPAVVPECSLFLLFSDAARSSAAFVR